MTEREPLLGSSFRWRRASKGAAITRCGAALRFNGREDGLTVDGKVARTFKGADRSRNGLRDGSSSGTASTPDRVFALAARQTGDGAVGELRAFPAGHGSGFQESRAPTVLAASNTIAYRFPDFPVRSAAYGRSLESTAMGRNHHGPLHICDFPGNFRKYAVHRRVDLMR